MEDTKVNFSHYFKKTQSMDLKFKDLSYTVTLKNKSNKELLHKMSGFCKAGQVTALMGPSGAGKTTLLNVLSWRANQKVSGSIEINGIPRENNHKRYVGYVMQKDFFFPNLTVYQSLYYTAHMKRGDLKSSEIKFLLDGILDLLHLTSIKNTKIGDAFHKGISGGEMKRLNIATEIISNPSIFFLDEPTTGLDSNSAVSILDVSTNIAEFFGINVILSIHQPSSQAFGMLKSIILISDGYIVYQGAANELYAYLAFIGYPTPDGWNVSDFVMDLLYDEDAKDNLRKNYFQYITVNENGIYYMTHRESMANSASLLPLSADYHSVDKLDNDSNNFNNNYNEKPMSITDESKEYSQDSQKLSSEYIYKIKSPPYYKLSWLLFRRGLILTTSGSTVFLDFLQSVLIAFIIGVLWFQSMNDYIEKTLEDRIGFLFFFSTFWMFVSAFTILSNFSEERIIIAKERSSKTYPVSAFVLAKTFTDVLNLFVFPTIWFLIVYFMTGLTKTATDFFAMLFTLIYVAFVSHSIGFAVASVISGFMPSITVLILYLLATMLTAGLYIAPDQLPAYLYWIRWFSISAYGFSIVTYINFENRDFLTEDGTFIDGHTVRTGISSGFPLYGDILLLFTLWLIAKSISYLSLRYGKLLRMG